MSDPGQDKPTSPPPATWAGRERSPGDEPPVPDEEHGDGPTSGTDAEEPEEAPGADEPEETPEAEELEAEPDADGLEEETLAEELGQGDGPDPAPEQATVEADTPVLADREAAREAALAGLRARTAEHAAKPAESRPTSRGSPSTRPGSPSTRRPIWRSGRRSAACGRASSPGRF